MVVIPVATQRQVCTALFVQKIVEIPQVQFLDLVVVPVLCNDKFGTDSSENSGIAAGAAPVVLWTSL